MKVVSVVGARPQFIKAAPVSAELRKVADEYLVHTGQHYDAELSSTFFAELGIPEPDVNLGVGSGPHGQQTGRMLERLEVVLLAEKPDWVLVYGDTNSTLAGALGAAKLGLHLAHVEAGLRSFRRDMPEEINRVLTDRLSDLLFCPTKTAVGNLAAEGITGGVLQVGDVMVDALEQVRPRLSAARAASLGAVPPYFAATLHRAENVDPPERLRAALEVLAAMPQAVFLPVHPRTAAALDRHGLTWPANVQPLPPLGYLDMLSLVAHADALLTDSGGLQKEAVLLGTKTLTLRDETEWVETLAGGMNSVVGLDPEAARAALESAIADPATGRLLFPPGAAAAIVAALRGSPSSSQQDPPSPPQESVPLDR